MACSAEQVLDVQEEPEEAYRCVGDVLVEIFGGPVECVSGSGLSVPTAGSLRSWGEVVRCMVEPAGGGSCIKTKPSSSAILRAPSITS